MNFVRCLLLFSVVSIPASAQDGSINLLRNGNFQDDWITLLPEMKNHHWCYPYDFYNRRDFNPDGWTLKGKWTWEEIAKEGCVTRYYLTLTGPAEAKQRVNWFLLHDDRALEGFPDAGGYPVMKPARSKKPETLVRDMRLRVLLSAAKVPEKAGTIELAACPSAGNSGDPFGAWTPPLTFVALDIPAGTYEIRQVEIILPAKMVLQAMEKAAKDPKEAPLAAREGPALPSIVQVAIRYRGKEGQVQVHEASLTTAPLAMPTLLPNGTFTQVDENGKPRFWSEPMKYRYFPPRHYYIFNTWHNTNFANRGSVAVERLIEPFGLRMIVPSGDETMVLSDPIVLNQKEPRLIEVTALVRTDRLAMMQIDAIAEDGQRLDGFNWVHKAPASIGTDVRMVRQVFRPRAPVKSIRLALGARGVNGFTLDDTGHQPQNNVVGTIWWNNVRMTEPESTEGELAARGVKKAEVTKAVVTKPHLRLIDLGERSLGKNKVLADIVNPGPSREFSIVLDITVPSGKKQTYELKPGVLKTGTTQAAIAYHVEEPCPAYTEYRATLTLKSAKGVVGTSEFSFAPWTVPIDVHLGALYLAPGQKQYVRMNFGLAEATMKKLRKVRFDVVRRGDGKSLKSTEIAATPDTFKAQRSRIPDELRGDLAHLLLADVDVSFLPVQPFADPQRNWFLRVHALDEAGKSLAQVDSQPFCRLAHDPPQPPAGKVTIDNGMVLVNGQPWMPWGVTYGHNPVYAGPADPGAGKYRDLANLPEWSLYDRHGGAAASRGTFDLNCLRYVAGSVTPIKTIEEKWAKDNLYASTAFATPDPAFSLEEAFKKAGGKAKLDEYLAWCARHPAVISTTPGIEEAFGLFLNATPPQLKGMEQVADYLRKATGKPVMVSHGGYWNRLEFERVPFFDIFDPETEPLYPANLHTDLTPIVQGKNRAIWLRPQMYESVPYERWRFHVYVELMRGARGWQIAHGPGDASLFRGLHGEMEFWKPIAYSEEKTPPIKVEPSMEHWSRRHKGKTYLIAATTHGIPFGKWHWNNEAMPDAVGHVSQRAVGRRTRITEQPHVLSDESNAYAIGEIPRRGPATHGIQYLPDAKSHAPGSKLVQWVRLDPKMPPQDLTVLIKADGRWTHAAGWGKSDLKALQDPKTAYWFLNTFYRHAKGFLGWGNDLVPKAMEFVPSKVIVRGPVPDAGKWVQIEVPLKDLGVEGRLIDGIGFLHGKGRVYWGKTAIVAPDGTETLVFGDDIALPEEKLARTRFTVDGLKKGTRIRVLFEDRELIAGEGFFTDDLRGQDLYQRHGGGYGSGYGDAPVALRLYEIP